MRPRSRVGNCLWHDQQMAKTGTSAVVRSMTMATRRRVDSMRGRLLREQGHRPAPQGPAGGGVYQTPRSATEAVGVELPALRAAIETERRRE